MNRNEDGMVTAFVTVIVMALFMAAGLVIDGGMGLQAKSQAIDEAQEAARAGAQSLDIDVYRKTGVTQLDPAAATSAVRAYLAATGDSGDVSVDGDTVRVTVHRRQRMSILGVVGIGSMELQGTGTAVGVRGIEAAE